MTAPDPFDPTILQHHLAELAPDAAQMVAHFYGHLFAAHPETMAMFPLSMAHQRDRFVSELILVVSRVDRLAEQIPRLQALGRDHRKYGAQPGHFAPVGESLVATLRYFSGDRWTQQRHDHWLYAYSKVAEVMSAAMLDAERSGLPAWWDATITSHDRRRPDLAVITVRPDLPYPYLAGQSVPLSAPRLRPAVWRHYSPANAPGVSDSLELHIRSHPDGTLSTPLVRRVTVGERVQLGPPTGRALTLHDVPPDRPILLLAGGTGLAPLKAILQQLVTERQNGAAYPPVCLVIGARTVTDLYDLPHLEDMARPDTGPWRNDWLTILPTTDQPDPAGRHLHTTHPSDVALTQLGDIAGQGWEVYICGPPDMARASRLHLQAHSVPPERIHTDDQDGTHYTPTITPAQTPHEVTCS